MTDKELQTAIDSLLKHMQSGSSYVNDALAQLKALFAEQLKRAQVVTEEWK